MLRAQLARSVQAQKELQQQMSDQQQQQDDEAAAGSFLEEDQQMDHQEAHPEEPDPEAEHLPHSFPPVLEIPIHAGLLQDPLHPPPFFPMPPLMPKAPAPGIKVTGQVRILSLLSFILCLLFLAH